jgi:hypothetical protein
MTASSSGVAQTPAGVSRQALAVMKVQMPQGVDVLGLEAAHLAGLQAPSGLLGPRRAARMYPTPVQAGALHEAAHAGIGGQRREGLVALHQRGEVVIVQLHRPARVVAVLRLQRLDQSRAEAALHAGIASSAPAQCRDRILRVAGEVLPALQCRKAETLR